MNDKDALRSQLRAKRGTLAPAERSAHGQDAAQILSRSRHWQEASRVAVYMAADGELDPVSLVRLARAQGKSVYLPALSQNQTLRFLHWEEDAEMVLNRYGIPEPIASAPAAALSELDLVCLPLVAWSRDGTRLGMGGGFYDKTLAGNPRRGLLVGLAYNFQEQAQLPRDPWDVALDLVVTESVLISCTS